MGIVNDDVPSQPNTEEVKQEEPSDKLTPDHPRFKQVVQKLHEKDEQYQKLTQEFESLKASINERQKETRQEDLTLEEQAALAKIEKEFVRKGFMTREDYEREQRVNQRAESLKSLADRLDGKNGMPKFVREDVIQHAREKGFGDNYEAAYRDLHWEVLVEQEAKKRSQGFQAPGMEKPTGGERKAGKLDITPDEIEKMSDSEYEKRRDEILKALKP